MNAPHNTHISEAAAVVAFSDAIRAAGLTPPEQINADGEIHRFGANGKRTDDAGWYSLHLDGVPAGIFGSWRDGTRETWSAKAASEMTQAERDAHRQRIEAMKAKRDAEQQQRQQHAQAEALALWAAAPAASADHAYLLAKGIKAHGIKKKVRVMLFFIIPVA